MSRETFRIGALYRREFRRRAFEIGLHVDERNHLVDSDFYVSGHESGLNKLRTWVQSVMDADADEEANRMLVESHRRLWKRYRRHWWEVWKQPDPSPWPLAWPKP